jgi:hypothetical protein
MVLASSTISSIIFGDFTVCHSCHKSFRSSHYHSKTGVESRGWSFVLWCLFAAVYATYACTWVSGRSHGLDEIFPNFAGTGFSHGLVLFKTPLEVSSASARSRL